MKHFTLSFRRMAAMLLTAMPMVAWAQGLPGVTTLEPGTYHYEYIATVETILSRDQIRQTNNHELGLHWDEPDNKCIEWSAEEPYCIHNKGELSGGQTYYTDLLIIVRPGATTYTFVEKPIIEKEDGKEYFGETWAVHKFRVINGSWETFFVSPTAVTSESPSSTAVAGGIMTSDSGITTALGDDDVVELVSGYVLITRPLTSEDLAIIFGADKCSPEFIDKFRGVFFHLKAGKGTLEFDIETSGSLALGLWKGTEPVGTYTMSDKGKVSIPYDLAEDTWFYACPVTSESSPSSVRKAQGTDGLKIYNVMIAPGDTGTGVESPLNETEQPARIYNVAGQQRDKMQRGLNISDGKKILVK